ncbi:toll/interleukin-1 receptor domain-containing protein [Listeria booriae]|uniref:toll/interleukin-1 receptor domain-containing protein n=1 Tax=Listeria booriae TaxID=1552123 RepID=UPI002880B666|nr:toll/interleukin-1 receptor domain-containing protein [Listeria booriae]MDT0112492.1 toll/interleukin-1 receptor domain-containing protein [Listeria booriae]
MVRKSSIFISHSSLDKDVVGILKSRIHELTVGSIDIFVSSDGESIPFGSNWLATIEDGLKASEVMFLFITPNSINNMWIAFEAGFGYSKGIKVIPICFGVGVSDLKPPLSILQGFDLNSFDSLNNIIVKINDQFHLSCKLDFNQTDFLNLKQANGDNGEHDFFPIIDNVIIDYGRYYRRRGEIDAISEKISAGLVEETKQFFDGKSLVNSIENDKNEFTISLAGIEMYLSGPKNQEAEPDFYSPGIKIDISCFGLKTNLLNSIDYIETVVGLDPIELEIKLKYPYNLITESRDVSAILNNLEGFKRNPENSQEFIYKNMKFKLYNGLSVENKEMISTIVAQISSNIIDDLYELMDRLLEVGIIYDGHASSPKYSRW